MYVCVRAVGAIIHNVYGFPLRIYVSVCLCARIHVSKSEDEIMPDHQAFDNKRL